MDDQQTQNEILNWVGIVSSHQRVGILKILIKSYSEDLKWIQTCVSHQKRSNHRKNVQLSADSVPVPVSVSAPVPEDAIDPMIKKLERNEKMDFIKMILKLCSQSELKSVLVLCTHAKRNRRHEGQEKKLKSTEPTEESVSVPTVEDVVSEPAPGASEEAQLKATETVTKPWWHNWQKSEIIALDCENVSVPFRPKLGKRKWCNTVAATITTCDYDGKTKSYMVYHEPGTFLTNNPVTGFKSNTFINGRPIEEVRKKLEAYLHGKLIILHGAAGDFDALGLNAGDFDYFDLQSFWRTHKTGAMNEAETESISLRSVYHHYYKVDIQAGHHDAATDARATLRLFKEQYIKLKTIRPDCKSHCGEVFDEIIRIK